MSKTKIEKFADILVNYSLEIKKGQKLSIKTSPLADELTLAVYEEAIKKGAHVFIQNAVPGMESLFYKYASKVQI